MKIGKIDMNLRVESLRISQTLLKIFIFYFLLILPLIAIPQEIKNRVNNNKIRKPTDALPILSKSKSKKPNLRNQPPKMMGADPSEPITMEFSLEWTNYKAHLVNESGPLEIIMNGNISSNNPEIWALSCVQPTTGIPPKLYFVEDVLGRSGTAHGSDLALNFEISITFGTIFIDLEVYWLISCFKDSPTAIISPALFSAFNTNFL